MAIINKTGRDINPSDIIIASGLECTKSTVYSEGEKVFVDWYGKGYSKNGYIIELHIPKMSLDIYSIESDCDIIRKFSDTYEDIEYKRQVFVTNLLDNDNKYFTIEIYEDK